MKTLKINFGMLALILGLTLAFVTQSSFTTETNLKYSLNVSTGVWSPESGAIGVQYNCESSFDICTATFPPLVDPNDQDDDEYEGTAEPSEIERGIYYDL